MTLSQKNQLMKINMSVWITENSNILSYDDVIANERFVKYITANFSKHTMMNALHLTPLITLNDIARLTN